MISSDQEQYPDRNSLLKREAGKNSLRVPLTQAGWRLDKFLSLLVPNLGMRGRRRMIEQKRVTVDGRFRPPGFHLRHGQEVEVISATTRSEKAGQGGSVRALAQGKGYVAFLKPGGMHTVALPGSDEKSLEGILRSHPETEELLLVNRLDRLTSGIVMAARTTSLAKRYKEFESSGEIIKTYFAIVHGRLKNTITMRNALDTANRKVTKVLEQSTEDRLRWTRIRPLYSPPDANLTLVEAVIHRGARHQIRVHLAHAGFPILGDPLYGRGKKMSENTWESILHLHHARIVFPEFNVQCYPDWKKVDVHQVVRMDDK